MADLTTLPPPPTGQTGVSPDVFSHLPPPPTGQQGMTLSQVTDIAPKAEPSLDGGVMGAATGALAKVGKGIFNLFTSSEQGFGKDIAAASTQLLPGSTTGVDDLDAASHQHAANLATLAAHIKENDAQGKDTTQSKKILQSLIQQSPQQLSDLYPALNKTNWQVAGDAGGTLLDILSAGTYGIAAKGAQTGKLLTAADHTAAMVAAGITPTIAKTLGERLAVIGTQTAKNAGIGGATGYGYDVAGNLQSGKTGLDALKPGFGTLTGSAAPIIIGGIRAGVALTKDTAPRFINSLIKPKTADFSYGKDPGRTVSELGITGNSLSDFGNNIVVAKQDIGSKLGEIYASPENAGKIVNAQESLKPIDDAIEKAAQGGKNNQNIVTQLQNIKDALLYEHAVGTDGSISKVSAISPELQGTIDNHIVSAQGLITEGQDKLDVLASTKNDIVLSLKAAGQDNLADKVAAIPTMSLKSPDALATAVKNIGTTANARDLSALSPQEAQDLIQHVADQTQFTGRPSDDKAVNSALKQVYGDIRSKITGAVVDNNPEVEKLNQQYGDLVSAQLAVQNRDAIVKRSDMISMPIKVGGAAGVITALATGGAAVPAILTGVAAGALDKALSSTAVKTRVAAWLGSESPSVIQKVLTANPGIGPILNRAFPALISKLNQPSND